jgi:hypothetical protein
MDEGEWSFILPVIYHSLKCPTAGKVDVMKKQSPFFFFQPENNTQFLGPQPVG